LLIVIALIVPMTVGCLADPQRLQSVELFDRLVIARQAFSAQPTGDADACTAVGDVQTRLVGEPGLSGRQLPWAALLDAAEALEAVCGQATLLGQRSNGSPAMIVARQRWERGIQRELDVACDHLRVAAVALNRARPC
jgi:hypothetical protein